MARVKMIILPFLLLLKTTTWAASSLNIGAYFAGCRQMQIDIAVSEFLNGCFMPKGGLDGVTQVLREIEEAFPGSVFSLHSYSDFAYRQEGCFTTYVIGGTSTDIDAALTENWETNKCNTAAMVSDAIYAQANGSLERLILRAALGWWNSTDMADASLNALTYMTNIPAKESTHLRIPLVITPKLPHYDSDPSNQLTSTTDRADYVPHLGGALKVCTGLQYVSIETAQKAFYQANATPAVLHTFDDPVVNGVNTNTAWTAVMSALGFSGHGNIMPVNPYGDNVDVRLRQLLNSTCYTAATVGIDKSALPASKKGGLNISNAVLAGVGAVGAIALAASGIYASYNRFTEEEADALSFSASSDEENVDVEVAMNRATGREEAF